MKYKGSAYWVDRSSGTHHLSQAIHEIVDLSENQIIVNNHYAALNYKDALSITGKAPISRIGKIIPGQDLTGIVVESKSAEFNIGDRVISIGMGLGETQDGSFSNYTVLNANQTLHLPSHWSLKMACGFGTAGFTAALALKKIKNNTVIKNDFPMLITGSRGGVGMHALLLSNLLGQKTDIISRNINDIVFDQFVIHKKYSPVDCSPNFLLKTRWSSAIDMVGGTQLAEIMKHITPWGNVVSIGTIASHEMKNNLYPWIIRGVNLLGMNASGCPVELKKNIFNDCFKLLNQDNYNIPIHTIKFTQARKIADLMTAGKAPPGRTIIEF